MGSLMDLEFMLAMEESKETQKNPFGNMNYELMDMGKNYDKNSQAAKIYGEKGDQIFWPLL